MAAIDGKIPEWKKRSVEELAEELPKYRTIALIDVYGLPAPQLHDLRGKIRDKMKLRIIKKTILKFAFEKVKDKLKNIDELEKHFGKMPGILLTDLSPFQVSKVLNENKAARFAKPGEIAPYDLVVQEGPTPFPAGPMISQLSKLGLKVKVEGGKIVVQKPSVVAKAGEPIKPEVADLLMKLNIKPMEIGLELTGAWEDGFVFSADILKFDVKEYLERLQEAASTAFNLSLGMAYPTKENIALLITKAYNDSKAVALDRGIFAEELKDLLLLKANSEAAALSNYVKEHA